MIVINPQKVKEAEIIVGIPSYCESDTISFVVSQSDLGLRKYFPNKKSVIINVDNNSPDGTKEAFFNNHSETPRMYVSTEKDIKGKGRNFHNLFSQALDLKGRVIIVLDADLRSIQIDWIKKMAEPILNGYDFISPHYIRCRDDATITNHLVYPLVYGLLGLDLRQPIGGDFSFSQKMIKQWLKEEWTASIYQFGIDIFMSLNAFLKGFKIAQVNLDSKIHNLSAPKLGPMFFQVTETLFNIILDNLDQIKSRKKIERPEIIGGESLPVLDSIDLPKELFRKNFLENLTFCQKLARETLSQPVKEDLDKIYQDKEGEITLELWVRIVYDFIYNYQQNGYSKEIIEALGCFYFGRVASFFKNGNDLSQSDLEKKIKESADYFYEHRDYLLNKI